MYLVDTSVWIDFLRGRNATHVDALKTLLEGDEIVGIAPIILQEILQGADSQDRFDKWRRYFSDLSCYISADPTATHIAAAQLYQLCRRNGKTPRSSNDCLIARIAIEEQLLLLHNDRDFDVIAAVEPTLQLVRTS
jgi:predicted nucleic acid-binding protein